MAPTSPPAGELVARSGVLEQEEGLQPPPDERIHLGRRCEGCPSVEYRAHWELARNLELLGSYNQELWIRDFLKGAAYLPR